MRRRALIVLLALSKVLCGRDSEETSKYNRGVVYSPGSNRDKSQHREEGRCESGLGCNNN